MKEQIKFVAIQNKHDDSLTSKLSIEYNTEKPFNTIFGRLTTLKTVIWLLHFENFNPIYLNKRMPYKEMSNWRKKRKRRFIPNHTEIFKLVVTDRLFSDRSLLEEIKEEFGNEIDNVLFVPFIKINRGAISVDTPNKNLKPYGLILTRVIRFILEEFKDVNIKELDKEEFHNRKINVKNKIWEDALNYAKEKPLMKSINGDITDDELKKLFIR